MSRTTEGGDANGPTASEFVPCGNSAESNGCRRPIRLTLRPTADGGVEVVAFEPYPETVVTHAYVCDACGRKETTQRAIVRHLRTHAGGDADR